MLKAVVVDIDGVLTDGGYYYSDNGLFMKKFNTRDASAIATIKRNTTIKIHALSYCDDAPTIKRLEVMNFDEPVMLGVQDKEVAFDQICLICNYDPKNVCYIGDSLADIAILKKVGLAICPADAIRNVKEVCHLVLNRTGGQGVLEELLCLLLNLDL